MDADANAITHFVLSYETLKAWCERQKYQFSTNAELGQLAVHYQLLGQPAPLMILPQLPRGMVMLVMKQPFTVPVERRAAIIDGTALLNATLLMGAWALNRTTGELFFRATVPALDIAYTDQGLVHVARIVVGTSEKAAPVLRSIALDGAEPIAAISSIATAG